MASFTHWMTIRSTYQVQGVCATNSLQDVAKKNIHARAGNQTLVPQATDWLISVHYHL